MLRKTLIACCSFFLLTITGIQAQTSKTPPADLDKRIIALAQKLGWYIGMHSDTIVELHKKTLESYFNENASAKGKLKPNETVSSHDQDGNLRVFTVQDSVLVAFGYYLYKYNDDNADFAKSKKAQPAVFKSLTDELGYIPEPEIKPETRYGQNATTYTYRWKSQDFTFLLYIAHNNATVYYESKCILSFYRTKDLK